MLSYFCIALAIISILLDSIILYQIFLEAKIHKKAYREIKGYATVIVPVKGVDPALKKNITSLLRQDFGYYDLVYVVDSDLDPAYKIISSVDVKVLISEAVCDNCSGKIRAQLTALKHVSTDFVVFADSDTVYPENWLKEMVSGLNEGVATTTFSWPYPLKLNLKNLLRAGFWTLGAELMPFEGFRVLWGGSMGFRRNFFDKEAIETLSNEVCDDCALTYTAKKRGKIAYTRAVPLNLFDERELLQWSTKEIVTILRYSKKWALSFAVLSASVLLLLLSSYYCFLGATPAILWIIKNYLRGIRANAPSLIPAIMSVPSMFYVLFLIGTSIRKKEIYRRGREYTSEPKISA